MGSTGSFAHLHNHSSYSFLDGKSEIDVLFAAAAELGMPAVAITDHGNLHGAFEAYKAGKKHGVNPIVGLETYMAPGNTSRTERKKVQWADGGDDDVSGGGAFHHLTIWAENNTGMLNLFKLNSESWASGFFYKPRADKELLAQYASGLIGTTGCPSGEVQTWLRLGEYANALAAASDLKDILGQGQLYVELMDHGLDIERRVREGLLRIARELGLPLIATNDLHYVSKADAKSHDAMLCVQSGSKLADEKRFRFDGDGYYLKTPAEMRALFAELPEACDNTLVVAERCRISFNEGADLMPRFPVPAGETVDSWFAKEVQAGMGRRFPAGIPAEHQSRAAYEVAMIQQLGFAGYFLVVADFIAWAREQGIRVGPGRGSAAGSIVAYAMKITELDPIRHNLMFERFLNPDRVSPPDIDIDFDDARRGEVIEYVSRKYGAERVAQIVTFNQVKAKAAIKDAARILGKPFAVGERISKLVPPPIVGKDMPLSGVFDAEHPRWDEAKDLRELTGTDPEVKEVIDVALGLEGATRQSGVHAAGLLLGAEPLTDHIPLMRRDSDGTTITQFDQKTCETLGLLKMDFLGLRNLGIMDEAIRLIRGRTGVEIVPELLPMDDRPTFELMSRGDTLGVFQLDGGPMRALLRALRPDCFDDISAVISLYRPGPMGANAHIDYADRKNGRQPIRPIHPELGAALEPILGETYGLVIYQEQVMSIAQQLAGYTLAEADLLRRAMGKKDTKVLQGEFAKFSSGMRDNGFSESAIQTLWDVLLPFSDYAFNRSHSAAYGLVSYSTGYLKANHPADYMAALLTSVENDKEKTATYLNECRRMGLTVLPPDVNESGPHYTAVDDETIRVGIAAIRNVGHNLTRSILDERTEGGPFASFSDFLRRTIAHGLNKRSVDSLIKAGAFDQMHANRAALESVHATAVDHFAILRKHAANDQQDLFASAGPDAPNIDDIAIPIDVPEWGKEALLSFEREMLGQYVSDHPLRGRQVSLDRRATGRIVDLFPPEGPPTRGGETVTLAGIITSTTGKKTRKGDPYVIATFEDTTGAVEITAFPGTYGRNPDLWAPDQTLAVKVRPDLRDDGSYVLIASSAQQIKTAPDPEGTPEATRESRPVRVEPPAAGRQLAVITLLVDEDACTGETIHGVKRALAASPGDVPVRMKVVKPDGSHTLLALPRELAVSVTRELVFDLRGFLGPAGVEPTYRQDQSS